MYRKQSSANLMNRTLPALWPKYKIIHQKCVKKEHVQHKLVSCILKELYGNFKDKYRYSDSKAGFSETVNLTTSHCL